MRHVKVRNHEKFQHYKTEDRSPPWIKWHRVALASYRFTSLADNVKWHGVGIALLATQTRNHIPADPAWIKGQIYASTAVKLEPLLDAEFLVWCDCAACESLPFPEWYQHGTTSATNLIPSRAGEEGRKIEEEGRKTDAMCGSKNRSTPIAEQVEKVWNFHLEARRKILEAQNGKPVARLPGLGPGAKKAIRAAIQGHGFRAALYCGRGALLDNWHTDPAHRNRLAADYIWREAKIESFADLYAEHLAATGKEPPQL